MTRARTCTQTTSCLRVHCRLQRAVHPAERLLGGVGGSAKNNSIVFDYGRGIVVYAHDQKRTGNLVSLISNRRSLLIKCTTSIQTPHRPGDALTDNGIKCSHPGAFFATHLLPHLDMTVDQAAKTLGVTPDFFTEASLVRIEDVLDQKLSNLSGWEVGFWKEMQNGHDRWKETVANGTFVPAPALHP